MLWANWPGGPAALFTFLEGMWSRRPTADQCGAVGKAMAGMHLAAADFPLQRANSLSVDAWRPLLDACGDDADRVEAGLRAEIAAELTELEADWPADLPQGVIHADLFPDNVFFLQGNLSGLIDFYFACNDILAYDLAICLCAWCFEQDGAFNVTKGRALIEGYQSVRRVNAVERDALPILARGASVRFLLTRLYDWINTPADSFVTKKDPKEYLRKSRFPPAGAQPCRLRRHHGFPDGMSDLTHVDIFTDGACSGNPGPGGGARSCARAKRNGNCPAVRPIRPTIAWSFWPRSKVLRRSSAAAPSTFIPTRNICGMESRNGFTAGSATDGARPTRSRSRMPSFGSASMKSATATR